MMAEILDALAKLVRLAARQAVTHPAIVKPLDMPRLAMQAVTFAVGDPAALVRALDTLLHPVESPVSILAAAVSVRSDERRFGPEFFRLCKFLLSPFLYNKIFINYF